MLINTIDLGDYQHWTGTRTIGETATLMVSQSAKSRIHCVVLAAGLSTRFGASKLTQEYNGKPLLQFALSSASAISPGRVHVVVGHDQPAVRAAADGFADTFIDNRDYRSGMGSSIAAGVRAVRDQADAILILLGDQPLISATHLFKLVEHWNGGNEEIIASAYAGTQGPPILFPSGCFALLAQLTGDAGAKSILNDGRYDVRSIECPAGEFDIDTRDQLRHLDQDSSSAVK
jgi:molybdenum cofactor cytidylyltransferase